jgi:hypothetical protein
VTRFASIGLAAVILAYGGSVLFLKKPFNSDDAVKEKLAEGWVPADEHPTLGTAIYQWDPYIETDKPRLLGPVTKLNVPYHDQRLTQVKITRHRNLLLDIKAGEQRYWVQK